MNHKIHNFTINMHNFSMLHTSSQFFFKKSNINENNICNVKNSKSAHGDYIISLQIWGGCVVLHIFLTLSHDFGEFFPCQKKY